MKDKLDKNEDKGLSKEELSRLIKAMKPGDTLLLKAKAKWVTNNKC